MRPLEVAGALRQRQEQQRQRQHLQQQHQRFDIRPCMEPSAELGERHQEEYKDVTETAETTEVNEKTDGQINVNEGDEEESEEARRGISRKPPVSPSPEELRIHRLTHYPFRSWCPACVAGRAKSWPHQRRQEDDDEDGVPSVSFDYCFLRDTPGVSRSLSLWEERSAPSTWWPTSCRTRGLGQTGWLVNWFGIYEKWASMAKSF